MLLSNNRLDDPIVVASCPGFAGGQRSYGPPDQLAAMEAAELLNVDIHDGTATTRRGTTALGSVLPGAIQGLCWFSTPAISYLVACAGGSLLRWNESGWAPISSYTAASATVPLCLVPFGDRLFLADGMSHLFTWDGTTLSDLGTGGAGEPPIGSLLISAGNRLWLAGMAGEPDALYASRLLDAGSSGWDADLLRLSIGAGEGDPITGIAGWDDDQVVVFKRNSIFVVRADPAATSGSDAAHALTNAVVSKISDTVGCVSHRSIARVGAELWFLSDQGVLSLGRIPTQSGHELKPAMSEPVHDVIQRIHWPAAAAAAGISWERRYLIAVPLDGATTPNAVLVYDTERKAWSGTWTGWNAVAWALSRAGGRERLNFGRADGRVWRWLDFVSPSVETESTFQDAGANVPTRIVTRALDFGDKLSVKSALSLETEFYDSKATARVAVQLDEDEPISLSEQVRTDGAPPELSFSLPATLGAAKVQRRVFGARQLGAFRGMQVVVTASAGKLGLRGVAVTGFVEGVVVG